MLMSSKLLPALAQAPIWDFLRVLILTSASTAASRWHHLVSAWQAVVSDRAHHVCTYIVINELLLLIFFRLLRKKKITIKKFQKSKNSTVTENGGKLNRWKTRNHSRKKRNNTPTLKDNKLGIPSSISSACCGRYGRPSESPSRWIRSGLLERCVWSDLNDPEWISTNNICWPAAGAPWVWTQQKVPVGTRKGPTGSPCGFSRSSSLRPWNQLAVMVRYPSPSHVTLEPSSVFVVFKKLEI